MQKYERTLVFSQENYEFLKLDENGTTNFVSQDATILLETPDAKIFNNKNCHYVAKVLLNKLTYQRKLLENSI